MLRQYWSHLLILMYDDDDTDRYPTPCIITAQEAKALAKLLCQRGYFHRGVVPWTKQDASSFFATRRNTSVSNKNFVDNLDQQWIIATDNGLCTIHQLRKEFQELLQKRKRFTVAEVTQYLGIDDTILKTHLHHEEDYQVLVFGAEIIARKYLEELVANMLHDLAQDNNTTHSVTEIADSILRVPFDTAFTLIEKQLGQFHKDIYLRRSDTGTWLLVTENYLTKLKQNLVSTLAEHHQDEPISLSKLAKLQLWEASWIQDIVEQQSGALENLGEFTGDVFFPRKFLDQQRQTVLDVYAINGFVSAHMCHASFKMTAATMKQYLKSVDGAIALSNSVVNRVALVEPLLEAITDCIESSSWLNLGSLIPLELLEYHQSDVQDLLGMIANPNECLYWIKDSSALLLSRTLIDSFRTEILPDIIQSCARTRFRELTQQQPKEAENITLNNASTKSAKEKHREREAARSRIENKQMEYGSLNGVHILEALTARYPGMEEIGNENNILLTACEDSFCTAEANEQYARVISKLMEQSKARNKILASPDNEAVMSFESGIASLCHLIQVRAKFLNGYASARCSSESMKVLRFSLIQTTCREFVLRITHAALVRANISVDGFALPPKYGNVDLSCIASVPTGSFITATGKLSSVTLKSLDDQLPSSVASLLIRLWKAIDTDRIMSAECAASDIEFFLETANDVCLPVSGMPFSKLDKKAEKRLLCQREIHLRTHLNTTNQLDEAIDLGIALLYQQVKNAVVFPAAACRLDVLSMLSTERKAPQEKIAAMKSIIMDNISQVDQRAHIDALIREITL